MYVSREYSSPFNVILIFSANGQDACNIQYYKLYKLNLTLHYTKHPFNQSINHWFIKKRLTNRSRSQ